MDRFRAMQVFVRIVELRSFSAAADDLNLPRATVTHTIKQLEKRLGVRLLQRTTRSVNATLDGNAYYQRCVRLLADLEETESAFDDVAANPKGKLRVDLQSTQARYFVIPRLPEFFARYPDLELEIGTGDRLVDLVREGVDCVLRAGDPGDVNMVGRRVASLRQITVASTAYLAEWGEPATIEDLDAHWAVNYFSSLSGKTLPFEFVVDGAVRTTMLKSKASVNNADAYMSCCEAGLGLIQAPCYGAAAGLAQGRLKEVLAACPPPDLPVSVLYPHHRQLSPRVRVFVEWMKEIFASVR